MNALTDILTSFYTFTALIVIIILLLAIYITKKN